MVRKRVRQFCRQPAWRAAPSRLHQGGHL